MRQIVTTYTCDRCSDVKHFDGADETLPSHWSILRISDGSGYRYLTAILCLDCRRAAEAFMDGERGAA